LKNTSKNILIKNKLIFLVIMPVIALLIISTIFAYENYSKHINLNKIEKLIRLCNKTSLLIHELQIERGASAGYLGNNNMFHNILKLQRLKTLKQQEELFEFLKTFDKSLFSQEFNNNLQQALNTLSQLEQYRKKVDLLQITSIKIIEYYSTLNKEFLNTIIYVSKISTNRELSLHLISYIFSLQKIL
jgi:methyl-accepting chemotaxis protein